MNALDWLRAHLRGELEHSRSPIVVEHGGHRLELLVSADAPKVGGIRPNGGARAASLLAQALGGAPLTPHLLAHRHLQSTVVLRPLPMLIEATSAADHSHEMDRLMLAGDYLRTAAGPMIVSGAGMKPWCITDFSSAAQAFCEGMLVDSALTIGERSYNGITYGPTGVPGVCGVRIPAEAGSPHPRVRGGEHDLHQGDGDPWRKGTDYSAVYLDGADPCTYDGAPDTLTAIYGDAARCAIVGLSRPMPAIHPGVELLADSPEWKQLLAEATSS